MATLSSKRIWFEEDLADDWKWSMLVKEVLFSGKSEYQEVDLVDTDRFGKILLLDGKMQSSEKDEWVYHEMLVHPALLVHPNPETVFIMGGGEGATAREVLRHKTVKKVVMVDIDKVVTDFCREHLTANTAAFEDPKLELINDDAYFQLQNYNGKFDVIIGDLADPLDGGPCYQLYTQEFYETIVKEKLNPGGIFVTQSGPCCHMSCKEVFTSIHKTIASVFPNILSFHTYIPSFCDDWSWTLAFLDAKMEVADAAELDRRAAARINGELRFLDGETFHGARRLSKFLRKCLEEETHIFTKDNPKFLNHGQGMEDLALVGGGASVKGRTSENGETTGAGEKANGSLPAMAS